MTSFDLVLTTSSSLHPDGEPDDFVTEYRGVIRCEGEAGPVRRVGKVHAYRIESNLAARYGEPLFDICDAHSQQMHELHALLYEPRGYGFKEEWIDRFDAMEWDCLVLDYVVLSPKWRGLRLGLLAVRKLVDLLGGGCGLAVADIGPIRYDASERVGVPRSWLPRHATRQARKDAVRRLRGYFGRMGFEQIGGTGYYGLPMARETPTLADLLRPTE